MYLKIFMRPTESGIIIKAPKKAPSQSPIIPDTKRLRAFAKVKNQILVWKPETERAKLPDSTVLERPSGTPAKSAHHLSVMMIESVAATASRVCRVGVVSTTVLAAPLACGFDSLRKGMHIDQQSCENKESIFKMK